MNLAVRPVEVVLYTRFLHRDLVHLCSMTPQTRYANKDRNGLARILPTFSASAPTPCLASPSSLMSSPFMWEHWYEGAVLHGSVCCAVASSIHRKDRHHPPHLLLIRDIDMPIITHLCIDVPQRVGRNRACRRMVLARTARPA